MARKSKHREKETARADIVRLMLDAKEIAAQDPGLARRHVTKAWQLAMRHRISMRQYSRIHCRKCKTYWTSKTLRVRNRPGSIVYSCMHCGQIRRIQKPQEPSPRA